jgi:predicted nucleic acid-binding protein
MILVDTNVFVDVIHNDPLWLHWSLRDAVLGEVNSKAVRFSKTVGHM